jgi:hypothetical protein
MKTQMALRADASLDFTPIPHLPPVIHTHELKSHDITRKKLQKKNTHTGYSLKMWGNMGTKTR